ncbi:hypothetical protein [Actimicrobium antarcticum]
MTIDLVVPDLGPHFNAFTQDVAIGMRRISCRCGCCKNFAVNNPGAASTG